MCPKNGNSTLHGHPAISQTLEKSRKFKRDSSSVSLPVRTVFERLIDLGLDSVELARLRFDLTMVYKIIFGHIDKDFSGLIEL